MPNQVLQIEPQNELKFKIDGAGMFEPGYSTYMKLTNPTTDTVLFKIKTTAPKKYCVRPNSGTLEPKDKLDIAITPQPVFVEPTERHKHKFMVQSVVAPEGRTNIDQVWKEISPEQLMEFKLKCVFDGPHVATNDTCDSNAPNEGPKKRVAVVDEKPLTPSKIGSHPKSDTAENDLQKVASEVTQLREEESKLRHENLQLKEEVLRLRQARDGRNMSPHVYSPEKQVNQPPGVVMMGIAVGMAFLGFLIGKFFM